MLTTLLHHGLEMDRTSCSRFLANQVRVLLTLAAYILFQELQRRARGTACADAQVTTLRERLLKLAVWVERSVRRIVLHLPRRPFPGARRGSTSPARSAQPAEAVGDIHSPLDRGTGLAVTSAFHVRVRASRSEYGHA
jgi:hypothetical protein